MNQGFTVTSGISEEELAVWLEKAAREFGTFDDGRVNYKQADIAPIIMCVVTHGEEVLLLKRGFGLADAEGVWSVVTGFIDAVKPVKEHVSIELSEELGLEIGELDIKLGESYTLHNPAEKRRYIVFPSRIHVPAKPSIVLNEEHTDFAWVRPRRLSSYTVLDDLPYAIDLALKLK